MESSEFVAEVEGVWKVYITRGASIPALRGVSLRIRRGEFLCIMGPSGSGKTTLLNLIGGLDSTSKGRILIDGIDLTGLSTSELSRLRHSLMGYIFQSFNLISVLNAVENVELPLIFDPIEGEELRTRAKALLERVGLGHRLTHRPSELSGGEQQRVAVSRALISNPHIVLADEPTANLDGKTGREILELMKKLNREDKVSFIIATHDRRVTEFADRVVNLIDGEVVGEEIVKEGSPTLNK